MFKKLFLHLLIIMSSFQLLANELAKSPKIQSLFTDLGITLNIEPFIPSDFVLEEAFDDNYAWAPAGVFEKVVEDPKFPHCPYIHIQKIHLQKLPQEKNGIRKYLTELKKIFPEGFLSSILHWGKYEVHTVSMIPTLDDEYLAFVPLSNGDEDFLIMFHLMYRKKYEYGAGNIPTKKDLKFWNDFLKNTKSL